MSPQTSAVTFSFNAMGISVNFDAPQQRLKCDRLTALSGGSEWDPRYRSNVFIERSTGTVMLLPPMLDPAWQTSGTGAYARYRKADTNAGSSWLQEDVSSTGIGDYFLSSSGPSNDVIFYPSQPQNAALWLAMFPFGSELGNPGFIECGWCNADEDPATSMRSLRIYANGKVQVYSYGNLEDKGEGTVSPSKSTEEKLPQSFVGFLIIPFRKKELLIVGSTGGAFNHVFEDLDESEDDPVITPAKQFWVTVPSPQQGKFQVAPIVFGADGYAMTQVMSFRRAPDTEQEGAVQSKLFGTGSPTATVVDPAVPASPYADTRDCRVKATLSPSGTRRTPFVYGAMAWFDAVTGSTPDGAFDAVDYVTATTFEVPDELCPASARITVRSPDELEDAGVPLLKVLDNRAVSIEVDGQTLINGVGRAPEWDESTSDENRRLTMEVQDKIALASEYLFSEAVAQDGISLVDAFQIVADIMGCTLDMDDPGLTIPLTGNPGAAGEWNDVIEVGNTAEARLRQLVDSYIANWFVTLMPGTGGGTLVVRDPATMSEDADVTLYPSIALAMDVGGYSVDEAWQYVYRSLHTRTLPPEANEVVVLGRDMRTGKPILVSKRDADAQDPTLPIDERTETWTGSPRKYGWRDQSGIVTQEMAERCCELLFDRLSKSWKLREFEAEMQFTDGGSILWKGGVVDLYGVGKVRIKSLSGSLDKNPSDDDEWKWRPVRYIGDENLRPASIRTSSRTLKGIEAAYKTRLMKRARLLMPSNHIFVGRSSIVSNP